ncbi:MAG: hypothetical protein EPN43_14125 [Jatrophihabitans sp.]|nr:MAG: hypothetical protein EPN43_14125 [Jatrophihabitans sp.]
MTGTPVRLLYLAPVPPADAAPGRRPVDRTPAGPEFVPDLDAATAAAAVDLLAHWWSRPLPPEVDTWLRVGDLARAVGDACGTPEVLACDMGDTHALMQEYERLFVGPGPVPCPPYESYWRNDVPIDLRNGLMGPCTAQLRALYGQLGLQVRADAVELPDMLAIELEALAFALVRPEAAAVARALFVDHLSVWLPWFCRTVERAAEHRFYRDLAVSTRAWLPPIEHHVAATAPGPGTT